MYHRKRPLFIHPSSSSSVERMCQKKKAMVDSAHDEGVKFDIETRLTDREQSIRGFVLTTISFTCALAPGSRFTDSL